jgi:ubiquitin-small subunit ribosomal protein S27Ae
VAAKGAKKEAAKGEYSKISLFKVEGEKVVRTRRPCPKCGAGVFLAQHKNRESCGNCGHTEMKKAA